MNTTLEIDPSLRAAEPSDLFAAETISAPDAFVQLESAWRSLGNSAGGPIEQYDWALACANSTPDDRRPEIVTVTREGRLTALVPLTVKRVRGARRASMLGVDEHHEPMDVLAADPESVARLAQSLAEHRLPITFGRIPAESPAVEAVRAAFRGRGSVIMRPQRGSPYISLDASWAQPEKRLSSRRRSDLRRARRRAEELGQVTTEVLTPGQEELDALLDEAFEIESKSWKGEEGTALACNAKEAEFCRRYARDAARQAVLRLCFLRIDGRAVAMQFAMVHGGGFWLLKIGYDADFARCSPGILLLSETIAYAAREGLATFEFLGQPEPWIEVWTERKRPCISLRVYPYNLGGAVAIAADGAAKASRAAAERARRAGRRLRAAAKTCVMPFLKVASRNYIAGDTLDDARRVAQQLAERGLRSTIGFWDTESQTARHVADQYLAGLDALADDPHGGYLSIKLPALRFSWPMIDEVAGRARETGRRIHFDSLAPETADRTRETIQRALSEHEGVDIGYTLPGRWRRSLDDADWATQRGLFVRVVKGEWPDTADPNRDPHAGYLEVIDRLAGRAARVGVATHDPKLAADAVRRLQEAGTPCDVELLHGLPMRSSIRNARELGVDVRIYVPYGEAYMPYALSQIRRKPYVVWWLAKDFLASLFAGRP
ncbi:MAG: GNAT family N-acetyltransferase [Planctomycetes bacterium]|nr:GNAT family N-acetyltransferase [Planctomycetota bacterium]